MIRKALKDSGEISERLVLKGVEIINIIHESGIDYETISAISKLDDKELIDPSVLYNRLNRLTDDDWKRIFDLGEQTNIFSFNDISVLKTVIMKLKRKENIDLKRLEITEKAIGKLKKFGVSL
jgi:hypothetical protein